jgi:hypothetical protein
MHITLKELQRALKGLVVLSAELEAMGKHNDITTYFVAPHISATHSHPISLLMSPLIPLLTLRYALSILEIIIVSLSDNNFHRHVCEFQLMILL